jgi:hypothetical protein
MEEFRARLLALSSLDDIRGLIRELSEQELSDPQPLPYFVLGSVLSEVHGRLADRPLDPHTWDQVRDRLRDAIERVIDVHQAGDNAALFRALNALIRRWAHIRQELD